MKFHFPKKQKVEKFGKDREAATFSPDHDWRVLLIAFSLLLVSALVIHSYIFYRISHADLFQNSSTDSGAVSGIDKKKLQSALDYFATKAQKEEIIIAHPPAIEDPSK